MRNKVLEDLLRANIISENMTLIDHECIIMNPAYVHINQLTRICESNQGTVVKKECVFDRALRELDILLYRRQC